MFFKKFSTIVCCKLDVIIGKRIISFIGLTVSLILMTILINDRYTDDYYDLSRKTALALGLDWRHVDCACTIHKNDPEGKMISIVVVSYSAVYLVTNSLLLYATIKTDWRFTIPWLVCEMLGCFSKLGALIYHWIVDADKISHLFTTGSMLYIVIMVWWWMIVFTTQMCWHSKKKHQESACNFELSVIDSNWKNSTEKVKPGDKCQVLSNASSSSSPLPYEAVNGYGVI